MGETWLDAKGKEAGGEKPSNPDDALLNKGTNEKVSDDSLFDKIMEGVGYNGKFQKRFNIIFNFLLVSVMTMPYLNLVLSMSVPDHRCHVPGRNETNFTLSEWQELKLPKELNTKLGIETISSCNMYISSNATSNETGACENGWDYDLTWYSLTVPSMQNWVCSNELYVANTFVASRMGELVGIFVFGQLGDLIGRKPVYYIALTLLLTGRIATVFTSHSYKLFLAAVALGGSASVSVFQTPLVVGLEVSAPDTRAHIAFMQCVAWVAGNCLLPMLAWWLSDWRWLMLTTTLPAATAFLLFRLMPESPRWLASRGKVKRATKVLAYMAEVNGTKLPEDTQAILNKIASKKENTFGIPSLFSNKRLAKNTLMIISCWVVCGLSYYSLVLNISNMAGNPFMNFFWQALVELPGYVIGRFLSNRVGRRWTHTGSYCLSILFCIAVILCHGATPWIVTTFVTGVKLMFTISFYMVWLQAMEVYPTCVRQTGTSIGGLVANIFGVLGPYVVYLGTTVDSRLPYAVLLGLAVLGFFCSSMLPETLNKRLPETLEDAKNFGEEQKYWSFNKSPEKSAQTS